MTVCTIGTMRLDPRRIPLPLRCFAGALWPLIVLASVAGAAEVEVTIDPAADRRAISPLIYGTNDAFSGVVSPLRRHGGNRTTGYNWENNASNAGSDYLHQSDDFATWFAGIPSAQANSPAIVLIDFHERARAAGARYSIVTLPMAGYVAADKAGPVPASAAAPSPRWAEVRNTKPTALSLTPDLTDGVVYLDEMLNFLVQRFGSAASAEGIKGYCLDNEPDLWSHTHARLHPAQPLCAELITRTVDLAKTVKRIDPAAETIGFASYGFGGYLTFQGATDWNTERAKGNYRWFLDYYLDQLKQASAAAGMRLLDVIDLHNYSEARGGGLRVNDTNDFTNVETNKARLQAPRSLWDPTYLEDSWIAQWNRAFLPFLPNIQQSIDAFYPGTKLGINEYSFGGEGHVSGGLAQADALGIFGRHGVHMAALWPLGQDHTFTAAAFKLYLDYDGSGGQFGSVSLRATTNDAATVSVFAAHASETDERLHVIVLNKSYDAPTTFHFTIAGSRVYRSARIFGFDGGNAAVRDRGTVEAITNNRFSVTLDALSAVHLVLAPQLAPPVIVAQPSGTRTVTAGRALTLSVVATGDALQYQWRRDGNAIFGASSPSYLLRNMWASDAGTIDCVVSNSAGSVTTTPVTVIVAPSILTGPPTTQTVAPGESTSFAATVDGANTYQWQRNGTILSSTGSTLGLNAVQPADAGVYRTIATTGSGTVASDWALLGIHTLNKVVGAAVELVPTDIRHPNGNTFDQILLQGAAATFTADYSWDPERRQVTRLSFIDLDHDIVQVEYSGPGTVSIVLENPSGPARPANYEQDITYMRGHAGIVITAADATSHLSVFSVGRATAVNPLLFKEGVTYGGTADLAFIAIASLDGRFGGVRTANAQFYASKGITGIYAPGVAFTGPVYVGDITAFDAATPVLILGSASDTRITGGDLGQDNARAVQVAGLAQLRFTAGADSHGRELAAQSNRAVLQQDGATVTSQVVVNP